MDAKQVYSRIAKAIGYDGQTSKIGAREVVIAVKEASGELITEAWAKSSDGATLDKDRLLNQFILSVSKETVTYRLADMLQGTAENCPLLKPKTTGIYNENDYPLAIELPEDYKFSNGISTDTTNHPNIIETYQEGSDYAMSPDVKDMVGAVLRRNVPTKETTIENYQNKEFYNNLLNPYDNLTLVAIAPGEITQGIDKSNNLPLTKGIYDFRSAKFGPAYYRNGQIENGNVLPKGQFYLGKNKMAWIIAGEGLTPIVVRINYVRTHLPYNIDFTNPANNIDLAVTDDLANIIIDKAISILAAKIVPPDGQYQVSNNEVSKNTTNRLT